MALTNLERQEYDIVQIFSIDDVVSRSEFESAKSCDNVYIVGKQIKELPVLPEEEIRKRKDAIEPYVKKITQEGV